MIRKSIRWFLLLFAAVLVTKIAINPLVDRIAGDKAGLLGVVHWLGSSASDLWFGVVLALVLCLFISRGDMALGEKLLFCLPILVGLVGAVSYRLVSGVVPATRAESIQDPAGWLLMAGIVTLLIEVIMRASWHQVQLRCSENDSIWAYEHRYGKPYVSSGGPTVYFSVNDEHVRGGAISDRDLERARQRHLWTRFWGTDLGKFPQ
jgi:hypothetical protein